MDGLTSSKLFSAQQQMQAADVYTDLNSLQQLKAEEDKDEALKKVAQQFESMFLSMMLKSMRDANAVFEEDSMFNTGDVKFYRDMYDQQLTLTMAHSKNGVGIAESLYRQLSQSPSVTKEVSSLNDLPEKSELAKKNTSRNDQVLAQSPEEFVENVKPAMEKAAKILGLDVHTLVAQAALETGWGKSVIADEKGNSSFNLFNIKAGPEWQGKRVEVSAVEFENGTFKPEYSQFRAYSSIEDSVKDYVDFVRSNPRYQKALQSVDNASHYIRELHNAGYATDPQYAEKVLSVRNRLTSNKG